MNEPDGSEALMEIGTYELSLGPILLDCLGVTPDEEGYLVYLPRANTDCTFTYKRIAMTEFSLSGLDGLDCFWNVEQEEQGPRFGICLPSESPFPFVFDENDGGYGCYEGLDPELKARRDTPGPPFDFVAQDFRGDNEPRLLLTSTLLLRQPDLPGQLELEPGSASDDERHTDYSEGWRGPWVRDLISSQESGQSLGEITVQEKRGGWGLVLKLEPKNIVNYVPGFDDDTKPESSNANSLQEPHPCISEYTVKVTVLQVLVTPTHLESEIVKTPSTNEPS